MSESQISVPCIRDGRPSAPHGEHHEPRKGMGGQGPKVEEHPRVPLCRACHDKVHDGDFTIKLYGEIACTFVGEVRESERAMVVDDQAQNPIFWSDERVCAEWQEAEEFALDSLARQCRAAYTLWQRYGWIPLWYESAAMMLSEHTGRPVYWRRVYERVALWQAFAGRWDDYALIGNQLAIAVAEDENPAEALEIAAAARDSGHTVKDAVAMVRARDRARAAEPPPMHECPDCGARHRIKK